ncbi:membrane protein YqaA with SNARE-associated domain [Cytobacillus horneckiae]|uniref:DedA family protein n=1 Tax=Cytobacillus horneckiae TaxID=549687 RepID=A0A2N0ZJP6_9BACI|nr:YqaA family protein [Cytobacillus horneckiae]MBN6888617.1 DedA family protein [Cytobacillus horneckiae]MCM3180523.1 DedA family protein [Cytobacillus horneckiae]MEC1158901.1 DedA family protein [Cytobacillus horneckiae]MED2938678.1 DedA family protein [Cytobacillus horneckiae]PKG29724.1 DedA family protein [Cytobacillus horneckiae]
MSQIIHIIKEWLMEYGVFGLFIVSFADSSFFPIPPDVLLIPMGIADPDNVLWYAFLTTFASVMGAIFGWYIGFKLGRPVLKRLFSDEKIDKVEYYYNKLGPIAILISAFTPLPYKIFTIFSGISKLPLKVIVFWSVIGRGARFGLEAALIIKLGAHAVPFFKEHFSLLTISFGILFILFYIVFLIFKKRPN